MAKRSEVARNLIRLLPGKLVEITLTQGQVALIDLADLPLVAPYRWWANRVRTRWYAQGDVPPCRNVRMHVHLMGCRGIDHRDGDGLNNTRRNLRRATPQENMRNRSKAAHNTSGYKGVAWRAHANGWMAYIGVNGRQKFLGYFDTPEEAARAYDAAAIKLFGEFARLNFPTTMLQ